MTQTTDRVTELEARLVDALVTRELARTVAVHLENELADVTQRLTEVQAAAKASRVTYPYALRSLRAVDEALKGWAAE